MGRHHQIENYISQMKRLKSLVPEMGLSTDLIVGFPTETEEEFQETIKLLDAIEYDNIFAFAYSPRPGTRAAKMEDDVPLKVKNRRLNELLQHQLSISKRLYEARIGQTMEAMVEQIAKTQNLAKHANGEHTKDLPSDGRVWTARTTCNRPINFVDPSNRNYLGAFLKVKVTGATALSLSGELIHDATFAESDEGLKYTNSYSSSEVVQ